MTEGYDGGPVLSEEDQALYRVRLAAAAATQIGVSRQQIIAAASGGVDHGLRLVDLARRVTRRRRT